MEAEQYYHIFNRTNNKELLFKKDENYHFFLKQLKKYIAPIADIFAYCLLPNHFHLVIQVKEELVLKTFFQEKLSKGLKPLESLISLQFGHLFNSYTQAINKRFSRQGSLFSPNFKRKQINTEEYLRQVIVYVHLNPFNHGLCSDFKIYPYSSYKSMLSNLPTSLKRNKVIALFEDVANFKFVHEYKKINEELLNEIVDDD